MDSLVMKSGLIDLDLHLLLKHLQFYEFSKKKPTYESTVPAREALKNIV